MTSSQQDDRVPELDGMRGLAILMVLFYHIVRLNPAEVTHPIFEKIMQFAEMGWAGVDVFFVLSGFLITSILLRTKKEPGYFKKFYARRILRIFPLYYSSITLIFLFVPLISPEQTQATRAIWPWYYLYLQNWGNALNLIPTIFSIGITWSLAIEEQFYMFWPSAVRFLNSKKLGFLSVGLIAFSLILRLVIVERFRKLLDYNKFFYFATITRLDSLILGALLAILFESEWWRKVLKPIAAPVFLAGMGTVAYFAWLKPNSPLVDNYPMYTYGYTIIAITSAALIIMLTTYSKKNPLRSAFRSSVLAFFGKYSYAIYLFHMIPILIFQRLFENNAWDGVGYWALFNVITLLIPVIMALASWNLLEKRMLDLKKHFEYQPAKEQG
jgi:peptidoglycan/LPS O-acetylase OafA/YrhL